MPGTSAYDYTATWGGVAGSKGLPLFKPPFLRLSPIDMNIGAGTCRVRGLIDHPAIKDLGHGHLGNPHQTFIVVPERPVPASAPTIAVSVCPGNSRDLSDETRMAAGKELFDSSCAEMCRGFEPVLFIGRTGLDEQYVSETIRVGSKSLTPMPSWGDMFTPEEIWKLVAYVKSPGEWRSRYAENECQPRDAPTVRKVSSGRQESPIFYALGS